MLFFLPMRSARLKSSLPVLLSAALVALFFHPVLSGENTFYFRDIHRWFYPMKYFLAQSLQQGEIPFWCSSYFCGAPFLSDIQSGVFYPLSLLFAALPFPLAFNWFVCLHFFLGFLFCYLFLKQEGRSNGAALLAAAAYGYGGYTIASVNTLNSLTTAIWLPAVLWAFSRACNLAPSQRRRPGFLLVILFLVTAILGGEPQLFLMIAALLLTYAVFGARHAKWRTAAGRGTLVAGLGAAAIMVTMVQIGPTCQDFRLSARAGGMDYDMATRHSLPPEALKHLVLPLRFPADFATDAQTLADFFPASGGMPWLLTIYPGFLILPLALWEIAAHFNRQTLFWLGLLVLGLILALGRHTPVYSWFYQLLPFFRFPEKFMFLVGFALVVLAAAGLDHLLAWLKPRGARPGLVACLLLLVLVADLYAAHRHLNPVWPTRLYHSRHRDLAPIFEDPGQFRVFVDPASRRPAGSPGRVAAYHLHWQLLQMPHLGILSGIDHVDGNTGMELQYQWFIHEAARLPWPQKIGFLRAANVRYIVSDQPLDRLDELRQRVEKVSPLLFRLTGSLPRAWLVGRLRPPRANPLLELGRDDFNAADCALFQGRAEGRHIRPFSAPVDAVEYLGPGNIRIDLTAPEPAVLVLSESFYPGWQATVDGKEPSTPLRLNAFFQGVEVEKGRHTVEFVYRPPHFKFFAAVSVASLASLVLWAFSGHSSDHRRFITSSVTRHSRREKDPPRPTPHPNAQAGRPGSNSRSGHPARGAASSWPAAQSEAG